MELTKNMFAKPLHVAVKFSSTIRITSKKFMHGRVNVPAVLFALMDDGNIQLNGYQKNAVADTNLSPTTTLELKEFFISIYNNEDAIVDFLNGRLTHRYFTRSKNGKKRDPKDVNFDISKILNESVFNFFEDVDV